MSQQKYRHLYELDAYRFKQNQICIGYWLLKAISYLPLYVSQATRCINLTEEEKQYYNEGKLITCLQFSSGSEEQFIPYGYEKRNTRFHIFSITARKISDDSNFGQSEKEVLFKPFTHFMILKKESINNILHIYMRQIAIGQAKFNVLWVDDKIFQPSWQHKTLVEAIIRKNPRITIIPKCSTKTAMVFMASSLGNRREKSELRIVTTLARRNEENKAYAGIVLIKQLEEAYVVNLKMLILSDNLHGVEQYLKKMVVRQLYRTISNSPEVLKAFISFN